MSRWSASRRAKNTSKQEEEIDLSLHIPFKEVLAPRPRLPSVVNPLYPYGSIDRHICCMICKEQRLDLHVRFRIISQEATSILAKVGRALVWFGGWYQGVAIVSFLSNRIECLLALPSAFALCVTRDQFANTTAPRDATALMAGLLADSAG
jgi:hypothetical protein